MKDGSLSILRGISDTYSATDSSAIVHFNKRLLAEEECYQMCATVTPCDTHIVGISLSARWMVAGQIAVISGLMQLLVVIILKTC